MDNFILFFCLIFSICLIAGLVKPDIMIRWGTRGEKTRKNVLKYYGVGLIVCLLMFAYTYNQSVTEAKEKVIAAEEQKKTELKREENVNQKYVDLLNSGKTYEAMNPQERTDIVELFQTWDNRSQQFKTKYKSQKETIEKSKSDAESKWKTEKETNDAKLAAQKAEEDKIGYDTGITYDQLARTPDNYKGKKTKFSGKVVQVMEDNKETDLRIAVDGNYDTILFVAYNSEITSTRILENDHVTVSGKSAGIYKYKSTMGGQISVPSMLVDKIEINK